MTRYGIREGPDAMETVAIAFVVGLIVLVVWWVLHDHGER